MLHIGKILHRIACGLGVLTVVVVNALVAGPPFRTDDPQPVGFHNWEVYLATQYIHDRALYSGTAPHLEVNAGPTENLQLHAIVPLAYAQVPGGPVLGGLGDVELGAKYRFVQESDVVPQIGTFPLVEIPTGNADRGLGEGALQTFLPLWLQKSWGAWTSYGGGGYWFDSGAEHHGHWFMGWEVQCDLSEALTLGGEVVHSTAPTPDEESATGFTLGGIVNLSSTGHILFSAGKDIRGENHLSVYLAFQFTLGPGS
jgi:hypothetical protein